MSMRHVTATACLMLSLLFAGQFLYAQSPSPSPSPAASAKPSTEQKLAAGGGMMYASNIGIPEWERGIDNSTMQTGKIHLTGGMGYHTDAKGNRFGGFGFGINGSNDNTAFKGGFGGVLSGFESHDDNWFLGIQALLGIGGLEVTTNSKSHIPYGFPAAYQQNFAFAGQLELESGITVLPWLRLSGYMGMTAILVPLHDRAWEDQLMRFPHVGFRVAFGSFAWTKPD